MNIRTEPVLIRAAIAGVVSILALFGIEPPTDVVDAISQIAVVALPIALAAMSARSKVTPVQ